MAFRYTKLRKLLSCPLALRSDAATFATSTAPKMKAFAAEAADVGHKLRTSRAGHYVPVYVAIGMIFVSVSLGLHTAKQQIAHSPGVRLKKSKRETIPEVVEPETVANESEKFLTHSFFRKVAHIQDFDTGDTVIPNPVRKDPFAHSHRVETLKSVGVDPRP